MKSIEAKSSRANTQTVGGLSNIIITNFDILINESHLIIESSTRNLLKEYRTKYINNIIRLSFWAMVNSICLDGNNNNILIIN